MSPAAKDLQRHMAEQLQATLGRHLRMAEGVIGTDELFIIAMQSATDVACCAIASLTATAGSRGDRTEAEHAELIADGVEFVTKILDGAKPTILAKVVAGIAQVRR